MLSPTRMPLLFLGHGSPMNAIEDNPWSRSFAALGRALPRPRAILAISAHWLSPEPRLSSSPTPATVHDFGGFPPALHAMQYPAPGSPELAGQVSQLLGGAGLDPQAGLDHGSWSILAHLYPAADIPVVQLSLGRPLSAAQHLELGRQLAPLRDEGVLILGSGNIVHNLPEAMRQRMRGESTPPDWAVAFDTQVAEALEARDTVTLLGLLDENPAGAQAHPTPEHWWPLLYVYGASDQGDQLSYPITGFDWGSISMRSVFFRPA